jgi:NADP-dependent 3-hydroxy acid dehydrogenase YdfG
MICVIAVALNNGVEMPILDSGFTRSQMPPNVNKFYQDSAIPADSFARAVASAISQPEDVDINEILFRPTRQAL